MIDPVIAALVGERRIAVVDIGARAIPGHDPHYRVLVEAGLAELAAFDADPAACAELTALYPAARIVAAAVGDGRDHRLYRTEMASKSSLFPPNPAVADLYQTFAEGMRVETSETLATVRLDEAVAGAFGGNPPDLITMDIQGGEAMAIAGGPRSFAGALMVETEVEFVEQYRGQPLIGDIDCALRALGLVFHRFTGYATRAMRPVLIGDDPTRGVNQWLWADAVYYADPLRWDELPPQRLRTLAALMHHAHQSWDVAYAALAAADRQDGEATADRYLAALRGDPNEAAARKTPEPAAA